MSGRPEAPFNQHRRYTKASKWINKCFWYKQHREKLTASTACWRMDVNLENILFFDWTSFSREDLENSSIFFFLLLPPRSRLEVSYNDPCNERISVSNKTVTRCWPQDLTGLGTTTVNNRTSTDSGNVVLTLDTVALPSPNATVCLQQGAQAHKTRAYNYWQRSMHTNEGSGQYVQ